MSQDIQKLERQIYELSTELGKLRAQHVEAESIPNYEFDTLHGKSSLLDLFAGRDTLFVIHNMGQACRYCTLWADGINPFLQHLENKHAVVLVSKDSPEEQQRFAHSRNWRFRMASHGGGDYIREQSVIEGEDNMPGIVCYTRNGDNISRKNSAAFGPGDLFCGLWHILGLAGLDAGSWTPQYRYWTPPEAEKMDDGGRDLE